MVGEIKLIVVPKDRWRVGSPSTLEAGALSMHEGCPLSSMKQNMSIVLDSHAYISEQLEYL